MANVCAISNCGRHTVARGYCNAHYLRLKRGSDLSAPVVQQNPSRFCALEGCERPHYGEGLCRRHYAQNLYHRNKSILIAEHGGKCIDCGGSFHKAAMDFHHLEEDAKEAEISLLARDNLTRAREEAKKCVLLCSNCHRTRHALQSPSYIAMEII